MKRIECEFEADVLAAVVQSRWPNRVDAALREHARTCEICSDVAAVAGALDADRDEIRAAVTVPDSGRVWWLAQLRARREAAQAAGRPITAAQVMAFTVAVALLGACFGATSTWFQSVVHWVTDSTSGVDVGTLIAQHGMIAIGMLAVLLLAPLAIYFAVGKD